MINKTYSAFIVIVSIICAALIVVFVGIANGEEQRPPEAPLENPTLTFDDNSDATIDLIMMWDGKGIIFEVNGTRFELLELLKGCREFIDDYSDPVFTIESVNQPYIQKSWREQLDESDREKISEIKERTARRNREIKLREDIEAVIKILTELKEAQ